MDANTEALALLASIIEAHEAAGKLPHTGVQRLAKAIDDARALVASQRWRYAGRTGPGETLAVVDENGAAVAFVPNGRPDAQEIVRSIVHGLHATTTLRRIAAQCAAVAARGSGWPKPARDLAEELSAIIVGSGI